MDPRYTSQICSKCGTSRRCRSSFESTNARDADM
ncbi:MAG: hypothetical protein J2P21_02590 [Chloracidobacterium sp.]|nr:hypothetical protein [Chloracidobacterium sp.]